MQAALAGGIIVHGAGRPGQVQRLSGAAGDAQFFLEELQAMGGAIFRPA
jgi:hypothetical protein